MSSLSSYKRWTLSEVLFPCFELFHWFWCRYWSSGIVSFLSNDIKSKLCHIKHLPVSLTLADTHRWGWCWARCVGPPRRCSSGSGCWGAAGPRGPACPGDPGCWRKAGSCRCCRSSDHRGSETDSPPGYLPWTEAEENRWTVKAGHKVWCVGSHPTSKRQEI